MTTSTAIRSALDNLRDSLRSVVLPEPTGSDCDALDVLLLVPDSMPGGEVRALFPGSLNAGLAFDTMLDALAFVTYATTSARYFHPHTFADLADFRYVVSDAGAVLVWWPRIPAP